LARFRDALNGPIVFTASFGLEDQVILHHIWEARLDIDLVTLDTGRLFPETYATWEATEQRYGRRIRAIYPQHTALEGLTAAQGISRRPSARTRASMQGPQQARSWPSKAVANHCASVSSPNMPGPLINTERLDWNGRF
jgi:3'-phosphoadenosine 5'-phosphosulfate sulfotransferase (PAPS reductase)/FAD synthetase